MVVSVIKNKFEIVKFERMARFRTIFEIFGPRLLPQNSIFVELYGRVHLLRRTGCREEVDRGLGLSESSCVVGGNGGRGPEVRSVCVKMRKVRLKR